MLLMQKRKGVRDKVKVQLRESIGESISNRQDN